MSSRVYSIEKYRFKKTDKLFLDTNFWLFVYGERRFRNERVDIYQQAFARINAAQCQVYVDFVVLSEFVNVRLKEAWQDHQKLFVNPKAFRKSSAFAAAATDIIDKVEKILTRCHYFDRSIKRRALEGILPIYKDGQLDFNDHAIALQCSVNSWKIVTDDSDFAWQGIDMITANANALRKSK